jgi:hypothetical protein
MYPVRRSVLPKASLPAPQVLDGLSGDAVGSQCVRYPFVHTLFFGPGDQVRHVVRPYGAWASPEYERIQSLISAEVLAKLPDGYFTDSGFRDDYRYPLVPPWIAAAMDTREHGIIRNESDTSVVLSRNPPIIEITNAPRFTELAFDDRLLLLRDREEAPARYTLLEFATGRATAFAGEKQLFAEARRRRFAGALRWMTLDEYGRRLDGEL